MTVFNSNVQTNSNNNIVTSSDESTLDACLEFFSKSIELRDNQHKLLDLFRNSFETNSTLTMRALFYIRDIRGGKGERDSFRTICQWLADNHPNILRDNLKHIPTYGRWDDLLPLINRINVTDDVIDLMKNQFDEDMSKLDAASIQTVNDIESIRTNNPDTLPQVSLLGKWLPSHNTSSRRTRNMAYKLRNAFGLSMMQYQRACTKLRKCIDILETHMSQNHWDTIQYDKLPMCALKKHVKAFERHDKDRYKQFRKDVATNKKKVNVNKLDPQDIIQYMLTRRYLSCDELISLNNRWNSLPNYLENDVNSQCLVVCDTSGTMYYRPRTESRPRPIDVAISTTIYLAERMQGEFHNKFVTFSPDPTLVDVIGESIKEKLDSVKDAHWNLHLDLHKVYDLILDTACSKQLSQEQIPKKLFVITDMSFETACQREDVNSRIHEPFDFGIIDEKYAQAGYQRPVLVYWDVNCQSDSPIVRNDIGTYNISGYSRLILKFALNTKVPTNVDMMLEVLNSERYSVIN